MEINVSKLKSYGAQCSILYVEDDEIIRTQTKDFLSRFFLSITLAENGQEGLEAFKNGEFDLVITDINMPQMNGIEMIENIRQLKEEQPILVTSAHNDSENLLALINMHVSQFVLKPFNNKKFLISLYNIVENIINKREVVLQTRLSQTIVNMMDIGVLYLHNNRIKMCNQAFLKMGQFDSLETLQLEMPEVSIMFVEAPNSLTADSNQAFIATVENAPESDRVVTIENGTGVHDYRVGCIKLDEHGYIMTFTNITAIQKALSEDEHTGLPARKSLLNYLEVQYNLYDTLYFLCISVKNFDNIMKWYGKKDCMEVEHEASKLLQEIQHRHIPDSYLGYFSQNQFLLVLPKHFDQQALTMAMNECHFDHNAKLAENHNHANIDFHLSFKFMFKDFKTSHAFELLELKLSEAYDEMQIYLSS